MPDSTIADDLRAARALVERGWFKGWLTDGQRVCAVGALNIACNGSAAGIPLDDWERRDAAAALLRQHLTQEIAYFNDDPETTKQDVLNLFDKALADLGALA